MKPITRFAICAVLVLQAGAALADPPAYRNWGRWGDDDERGAANYITPERIADSARLVQSGKTFALGIAIDGKGPLYPTRTRPTLTTSVSGSDYAVGAITGDFKFADDYLFMPLQGATQWDGLSHAWYGDTLYNGVPESAVASAGAGGARRLGIENVKDSMVGRGVLVDVARAKGGSLPRGYVITRDDVEKALEAQGTEVRPGDIVLFHTGYLAGYYALTDPVEQLAYLLGPAEGLGPDIVPWLHEKQVAAAAADNVGFEAITASGEATTPDAGLHGAMLKDMGVYIGEIWWLHDLAEDCAKDGRYAFFLAAQPLNIPGGVGSPLNPIAIK